MPVILATQGGGKRITVPGWPGEKYKTISEK
jgi:hypothetical protein